MARATPIPKTRLFISYVTHCMQLAFAALSNNALLKFSFKFIVLLRNESALLAVMAVSTENLRQGLTKGSS